MDEHEATMVENAVIEAVVAETDDIAAVREIVLRAHPDAVVELISGATIPELLASVEPARAAYARVVAAAGERERYDKTVAPVVPAGDAPAFAVDPDHLPPVEKIRRGLAGKRP